MWCHNEINIELSRQLAERVNAEKRACWINAWRALPLVDNPNRLYAVVE